MSEQRDLNKEILTKCLDILCCPGCKGEMSRHEQSLICAGCKKTYEIIDGIPRYFVPNEWNASKEDVTEGIRSFYEEYPFPNYDDCDDVGTLIEKARKGFFGKLLDDQIPFRARVLECGCGTGQLTNFLSIANRDVIGTDICLNSLKMAHDFKRKNSLDRAVFFQMNLFRPCFRPESFDLVICNGVLHHTSDPFLGFKSISALVKQGGYILIGLYHRYGRLVTDMRRVVFRITGDRLKFLDRRAVNKAISLPKRISWYKDQYKNPHESKHTFGEVKEWFDRTGFEFIKCIPKTVPFVGFTESERLFHPDRFGSPIERLLVNIGTVFTGSREGGFFVMIGKRSH